MGAAGCCDERWLWQRRKTPQFTLAEVCVCSRFTDDSSACRKGPGLRHAGFIRGQGGVAAIVPARLVTRGLPSILFALYQLGYECLSLYDGSMGEWANEPGFPIETD